MSQDERDSDPYLRPGTQVRLGGGEDDRPEYGIVVHCWHDDGIGMHDCYVAFFGSAPPLAKPIAKPYILRYAAASLTVVDE